jgi:hypothetical protein
MTLEDRIMTLRAKHASLEEAIEQETRRPHPDDTVIAELKKQKLRIKDEIHRMSVS